VRQTLVGSVDNDSDKLIAEMRAREVTGVFKVDNLLTVSTKY
jgi:osmotically-inducible protein OsmY